jgi:hypothetical protein
MKAGQSVGSGLTVISGKGGLRVVRCHEVLLYTSVYYNYAFVPKNSIKTKENTRRNYHVWLQRLIGEASTMEKQGQA